MMDISYLPVPSKLRSTSDPAVKNLMNQIQALETEMEDALTRYEQAFQFRKVLLTELIKTDGSADQKVGD